jgi:CHAT domain-containing protein
MRGPSRVRGLPSALTLALLLSAGAVVGVWPRHAQAAPPPEVDAATALATAGRLTEAAASLEAASRTATGTARLEIVVYRASVLARIGRLVEGRQLLGDVRKAVFASRDAGLTGRWFRYLARAQIDAGEEAAAAKSLKAAVDVLARSGADPRGLDLARFSLASIANAQSDIETAYAGFADVLESAMARGDRDLEAKALMALGRVLLRLQRADLSESLLREAIALFTELGNHVSGRVAQARLGYALQLAGRTMEARQAATDAVMGDGDLGGNEWTQVLWPYLVIEAEAEAGGEAHALDEALAVAVARLSTPAFRDAPALRAEVVLAMGNAMARAGRYFEARKIVERLDRAALVERQQPEYDFVTGVVHAWAGDSIHAAAALERALIDAERPMPGASHQALARFSENPWIQTASTRLAEASLRLGHPARALEVLGRQKARALTLAVIRRAGSGVGGPASAISALQTGRALVEAVRTLQRPQGPLQRIAVAVPDRVALPAGRLGLEYVVAADRVHAFLVDGERVRHAVVTTDVARLRDETARFVADLQRQRPDWLGPAAGLGAGLLGPFGEEIRAAAAAGDRLTIVPHGFLHAVPFAALRLGDETLLDLLPVDEAPSLAVAAGLPGRRRPHGKNDLLLVGAVATETAGNTLPGAEREIDEIQAMLGGVRLTGRAATESAFVTAAGRAGRILLAAHGHPARGGQPGYIELGPSATHDGRLEAHDVLALDLSGAEVFLSACETAVGDLDPGDEMWGILDRAFLLAGARTVIATKWPVDDAATRRLVTAYFAQVEAQGPLGALREAQMRLRRGEAPVAAQTTTRGVRTVAAPVQTRYEHPYFWSGFKLMGAAR